MKSEFINDVNQLPEKWLVSDPYYYVRIDAIDHSHIDFIGFTSFTPDTAVQTIKTSAHEYFTWVGPKDGVATTVFSKNYNFASTGKYLIELMIWNKQTSYGSVDVSVGGTSIHTFSAHQDWNDYGKIIRVPITEIAAGVKEVTVTIPANCMVGWMRISKIDRFEGGREYNGPSETRLDLIKTSFTQNGITEVDKLQLVIAMKDNYYDFNGFNILRFDLGDHITLTLGENMDETVPMFGGYVEGWDINEEGTELTLQCVSRMWDLKRTQVLKNFKLGGKALGQDGALLPYRSFGSVQEAARYLCTSLYNIDYEAISRDYVLFNNFSLATDVTSLETSGFETKWETNFGTNGSAMTIRPSRPGINSIVLYEDESGSLWDASKYTQFELDYYVSGAGVKYPIKFNIEIDMYMTDQTPSDAITYVLYFNGPKPTITATKKILKNITPKFNGTWQEVSVNLKNEFAGVAPVSASVTQPSKANYYITEIRLVGQQDNQTVLDRRCSSLTLDNIIGYRSFDKYIKYATTDTPSAYDELKDICDNSNYMAYIRPGMERREDQMIFMPKNFYALPIILDETNIIDLKNLSYHPIEDGMINYIRGVMNYSGTKTETVTQADATGIKHYLPIAETEVLTGLSSLEAANTAAQKRLDKNNKQMASTGYTYLTSELYKIDDQVDYILKQNVSTSQNNFVSFELDIQGSTLMEPGQYIGVNYPKRRIQGAYTIESITHNIDFVGKTFTTSLGLNKPSGTFATYKKIIDRLVKQLKKVENNAAYNSSGALIGGMETSLGAYS